VRCMSPVRHDFKGKYRVQVNIDLGPFEAKHPEIWHSMS